MAKPNTPILFIGHGNPMNAITENPWREKWRALAAELPSPRAVLCVSAHWETPRSQVCIADPPETIHDFGGFPAELFAQQYPAPGAPDLAKRVHALGGEGELELTRQWGLDHGAWTVLASLFPAANIPVCQLSLGRDHTMADHFRLAQKLASLRQEDVLVLCSGNIVHNLRMMGGGAPPAWAQEFDGYIAEALRTQDAGRLIEYEQAGLSGRYAVPTTEHYVPMLYAAALRTPNDNLQFFNTGFDFGSISMRSFSLSANPSDTP